MITKILPVAVLALTLGLSASAQTKEKTPAPKEKSSKDETITIRKKTDDKTTIVIDGDNITVNGKPLSEMNDADLEVLRGRSLAALPKIRTHIAPMGNMKIMMDDDFSFGSNRALLGVVSEKSDKGAKINSVEKESAAEKAGLKKDDIITKVGDTKIEDSEGLYETIGKYKPEEKVTITYLRDGKESTATAILGKSKSSDLIKHFNFNDKEFDFNNDFNNELRMEMPRQPGMKGMNFTYSRKPKLGLEIQDLAEGKGVKVLDVDGDTPAAKAGLQKDDVITEIDGKPIESVDNLRDKLKEVKEGDSFKITYQRAGKTQSTEIKFPKKLKTAEL